MSEPAAFSASSARAYRRVAEPRRESSATSSARARAVCASSFARASNSVVTNAEATKADRSTQSSALPTENSSYGAWKK